MKQHEAQPLALDSSTQVGGIPSQRCGMGTGMLGWWWGELGWLSCRLASSLWAAPDGKGGSRAAGERLASGF